MLEKGVKQTHAIHIVQHTFNTRMSNEWSTQRGCDLCAQTLQSFSFLQLMNRCLQFSRHLATRQRLSVKKEFSLHGDPWNENVNTFGDRDTCT